MAHHVLRMRGCRTGGENFMRDIRMLNFINQYSKEIVIITGILLICVVAYIVSAIKKYVEKHRRIQQQQQVYEILKSINYIGNTRKILNKMCGNQKFHQNKDVSSNLVGNYPNKEMYYLSKYFGFNWNENTVKALLILKKNMISGVNKLRKENLYIENCFDKYIPSYTLTYTSPQGRSVLSHTVWLDCPTIDRLVAEFRDKYITDDRVKNERSKLNKKMREDILKRDNYTCQKCGNSIYNEPNLLLEVDHIIPISKGGKTEESNLQTLCWKCNREKSDKV